MKQTLETPNYKPLEIRETPYMKAWKKWDARSGAIVAQRRNWMLFAFGSSLIALLVIAMNFYLLTQNQVIPYVIEVSEGGEVRAIGKASQSYRPNDATIKKELSEFLRKIRIISVDPVIVRNNWVNAYGFVTKKGANFLNEYARKAKPLEQVGKIAVIVNIESTIAVQEGKVYQITWNEEIYLKTGVKEKEKRFKGIFVIKQIRPKDETQLSINPLGIYIDEFNFTEI